MADSGSAAPPLAPDLKGLLLQTKLRDVVSDKPLVAVPHTATLGEVLDILSQHGILSAPLFVADAGGIRPSVGSLLGFVDTWSVMVAFLGMLGQHADVTEQQLEAQGAALCARPVLSLFEGTPAVRALEGGDAPHSCADWDVHDDPDSSLLDVIRSCFLPRTPSGGLSSSLSCAGAPAGAAGSGGAPSPSPRPACASGGGSLGTSSTVGHSRHPAASHRIVVVRPDGGGGAPPLAVLSQSDILRFLAAHHECLRPLGKASLAELGLASGSLHLAAGPVGSGGAAQRPPPLATASGAAHGGGGAVPSSPKPPLCGGGHGLLSGGGGGGLLGALSGIPASPASSDGPGAGLQRASSGGPGGGAAGMSPPASPRVSQHLLSLGSLGGGHHHRPVSRRQLVAVHESVPALETFRALLAHRVSAVAVLAGLGATANMRLVGNVSATDLRHLRAGSFGRLALSVKDFLATKPLAPDTAIPLAAPPGGAGGARAPVLMAHAPGVFTCQATASLEELVRTLGAPTHGIHRVYVVDPDSRPAGVVTGSDVLALLSAACSRE
ncbi:hypothetical protein HT031_003485 [Scenedesmus sp. PABB004]|nr:hypothetical protein HT031_003485 [Scenedesmus sp. PABB004]